MKTVFYILLLAIIGTTIFSWFNINSMLIILLVICRLAYGGQPFSVIRTVFSNRFFLAYFSLFLIEVLGLFYTHDAYTAYKHIESKATLVAIPFFLCSGAVIDKGGFQQLMRGYCWLLAATCIFCLGAAGGQFQQTEDVTVFFYHKLTEVIGVNAVFFSGYVIIALLFLLSSDGRGRMRSVLGVFFTIMMILLASKLLLMLLAIIFLVYLKGWSRMRLTKGQYAVLATLVIFGTGALAVTRNPVGERYQEIMHDDLRYTGKHRVPPHAHFNGVSLRLLIWQFADEILNEQQAWVIGVSAGESQNLLNRK